IQAGATGNIQAGDINITGNTLQVKNNPFSGGQASRDFQVVIKADIDTTAATLTGKVTASMNAALQEQHSPAEQSATLPCHPTIYADHHAGDEASQVQVTVSETCTIIAYDTQQLTAK